MRVIGTINKRVDVGYIEPTEKIYIMSSTNCIEFTYDEMECLVSVLNMLHNLGIEGGTEFLELHHVPLWEPWPPPAGVKI